MNIRSWFEKHLPALRQYFGSATGGPVHPDLSRLQTPRPRVATTKGTPVTPESHAKNPGAPEPINPQTGQHGSYYVLSEEERAKGFVRPVRRTYVHTACQGVTSMSQDIAETYAREPTFYGRTFCCSCGGHYPVGPRGEFVWLDEPSKKVGE